MGRVVEDEAARALPAARASRTSHRHATSRSSPTLAAQATGLASTRTARLGSRPQ